MLSNRQINKIAKQMYPSSAFPYKERKHLRQIVKEALADYLDKNPNATYEEMLQHYADNGGAITSQKTSAAHIAKIIAFVGLLFAIVCIICYLVANSWKPPTYYF